MNGLTVRTAALLLLAPAAYAGDQPGALGLLPEPGRVVWRSEVLERAVYPALDELMSGTADNWCAAVPPAVATAAVSAAAVVDCAGGQAYDQGAGYRLSVDGKVLEGGGLTPDEAAVCRAKSLEHAGISIQADEGQPHKALAAGAWPDPAWRGQPVAFTGYWNYSHWIEKAEIRLFPYGASAKGKPFALVPLDAAGHGEWTPAGPDGIPGLRMVLRVYGVDGRYDETEPYDMQVYPEARAALAGPVSDRERNVVYGKNRLRLDRIRVDGAEVTVSGSAVKPGNRVFALGREAPVSPNGTFAVQEILPPGRHDVAVKVEGPDPLDFLRPLYISRDKWFYVAIADLTAGANGSKGPAATVTGDDDHYDKKVFVDGRLAYYLKGRIKGDWLLTASADTREQPLSSIFSGLDEKDPRYLLRRLDPDLYYPVYGDDSAMTEDAPTQGKFYVRLERRESYLMWGNYTVSLHGNELAAVDRGLYGARLHAVTGGVTAYGERKAAADAYLGDPGTLSAREQFRGTGGSLYYLRHLDITSGSDLVSVEVRDKNSGLVLAVRDLVRGQDYDIDTLQGRIVLAQPLASTSDDSFTVRSGDISGNPVYLVARYEYQPGLTEVKDYDLGGRVSKWFGDHVEAGVNAVRQNSSTDGDTTVEGADLTLRYTPATYIKASAAQSRGTGTAEQASADGGYTFSTVPLAAGGGDAGAALLEGALQFSDVKDGLPGRLTGYWKDRGEGFAAPGQLTAAETEQVGGALNTQLPGGVRTDVKYDRTEVEAGQVTQTLDVQLRRGWGQHWSGSLGSRYSVASATGTTGRAENTDVAAQLDYNSLRGWSAYGFNQAAFGETDSLASRYGLGGRWAPGKRWALTGEGSGGRNKLGGKLGSELRFNERSTFYTSYQLETDRSDTGTVGRTGQLVTGVRSRYSDSTSVFGEERWQYGTGPSGLTHAYGLDVAELDGWHWGLTGEYGSLSEASTGEYKRTALTGAVGITRKDLKWASALEYRNDRGTSRRESWLTRNSYECRVAPAWRLITKLAFSLSSTGQGDYYSGEYTEGVVGFAYRAVQDDRLNALFKYTYFRDMASAGQLTSTSVTSDYKQRSHVLSADANYDITPPLTAGAKVATRLSEVQAGRTGGAPWFTSNAYLLIGRLDWHVVRNWDLLTEGRYLRVVQARDSRAGALLGIYRHLGKNIKLGAGYNFTDFSDDLTDQSYTSHGWFINIVAKF